jgi:hypothetical protein
LNLKDRLIEFFSNTAYTVATYHGKNINLSKNKVIIRGNIIDHLFLPFSFKKEYLDPSDKSSRLPSLVAEMAEKTCY